MESDNALSSDECSPSFITFDCTEPHCVMQFRREDRLRAHLLLGSHQFDTPTYRLLDKATLIYKQLLDSDNPRQVPLLPIISSTGNTSSTNKENLREGWALFRPRNKAPFTLTQRSYLNQRYDEGEKSGAKWDAVTVAEARFYLTPSHPLFNLCFSIRTSTCKQPRQTDISSSSPSSS